MSAIIVTSIDWRHIFVSLQIFAPMNIWSGTMTSAVLHWLFKLCFPQTYEKFRKAKRKAGEEERAKGFAEAKGEGWKY
jgi:hypothetical protein